MAKRISARPNYGAFWANCPLLGDSLRGNQSVIFSFNEVGIRRQLVMSD